MQHFSRTTRRILLLAQDEASERRHLEVDTDHILLAMLTLEKQGKIDSRLHDARVQYDRISARVAENPYATSAQRLDLSSDIKRMLKVASVEAEQSGSEQITPKHLLIAMLQLQRSAAVELLFDTDCDVTRLFVRLGLAVPERLLQPPTTPQQAPVYDEDEPPMMLYREERGRPSENSPQEIDEPQGCLGLIKNLFSLR